MFADIRQMVVNNAHGCTLSVCPHEAQAARPHYAVHTAAFDGQQGRSMVSLNAQQSARLAAVQCKFLLQSFSRSSFRVGACRIAVQYAVVRVVLLAIAPRPFLAASTCRWLCHRPHIHVNIRIQAALTASPLEIIPSVAGTVYCAAGPSDESHMECSRSGRTVDWSSSYSG